MAAKAKNPLVSILMGSQSDWGVMSNCAQKLEDLGIPWEAQAISAHRATDALIKYLSTAEKRGVEVIIAAAGGAAHLPGVVAAKVTLPVLGVPMESASLKGMDSLLSIVQCQPASQWALSRLASRALSTPLCWLSPSLV